MECQSSKLKYKTYQRLEQKHNKHHLEQVKRIAWSVYKQRKIGIKSFMKRNRNSEYKNAYLPTVFFAACTQVWRVFFLSCKWRLQMSSISFSSRFANASTYKTCSSSRICTRAINFGYKRSMNCCTVCTRVAM